MWLLKPALRAMFLAPASSTASWSVSRNLFIRKTPCLFPWSQRIDAGNLQSLDQPTGKNPCQPTYPNSRAKCSPFVVCWLRYLRRCLWVFSCGPGPPSIITPRCSETSSATLPWPASTAPPHRSRHASRSVVSLQVFPKPHQVIDQQLKVSLHDVQSL